MKWLISARKDIAVDESNFNARLEYIGQVTNSNVSIWQPIKIDKCLFYYCVSNDIVDGIFITAHIDALPVLSALPLIYQNRIVVANTCIWDKLNHKKLLHQLYLNNSNIELYFSKQEHTIEFGQILRPTTSLLDIGRFGFQSSMSERELFMNRKKGLEEALKQSFERVSPILTIEEYNFRY